MDANGVIVSELDCPTGMYVVKQIAPLFTTVGANQRDLALENLKIYAAQKGGNGVVCLTNQQVPNSDSIMYQGIAVLLETVK